jgi:hypothetical protein
MSFFDVEEPLVGRGKQNMTTIGDAEVRLVDTTALFEVVQELYDALVRGEYKGRLA